MNTQVTSINNGKKFIPRVYVEKIVNKLKGNKILISLNCAEKLRKSILSSLYVLGWSNETKVVKDTNITITSIRGETGLCLQTGNVSRFYADLLKLQLLYARRNIKGAIYLLPTKEAAVVMGSNLVNGSRFIREMGMFKEIITIPLIVICFEQGEI